MLIQRTAIALVQVLGLAVWFSMSAVVPSLRVEWGISAGAAVWLTAVGFGLTVVSIQLVPLLAEVVTWRYAFLLLVPGPVVGALAMLRTRS